MARTSLPILPGNVELLALGALASGGTMHGFEILRWIERQSDGELLVEEGALYPALHRMEQRGWLSARWAVSERGRRAKYYGITASGRRAIERERGAWTRYVTAVGKVVAGEEPA